MAQNGSLLSSKQKRGLVALLSESSIEAAAERSGVSRRTVSRWLKDPDFLSELRIAEHAAIDMAVMRLIGLANNSIDVLASIVKDDSQPVSQRRLASESLLNFMLRLRSSRDLEERIEQLEVFYGQQI